MEWCKWKVANRNYDVVVKLEWQFELHHCKKSSMCSTQDLARAWTKSSETLKIWLYIHNSFWNANQNILCWQYICVHLCSRDDRIFSFDIQRPWSICRSNHISHVPPLAFYSSTRIESTSRQYKHSRVKLQQTDLFSWSSTSPSCQSAFKNWP